MGIAEAFFALIVTCVFAFVGIYLLLTLGSAFAPFDGSYSWEIVAAGISALIGAVVAAGLALKGAAGGGEL